MTVRDTHDWGEYIHRDADSKQTCKRCGVTRYLRFSQTAREAHSWVEYRQNGELCGSDGKSNPRCRP